MTVIITCPHCGRMESWREADGARTHCSFCHQLLSGHAQVTEATKSHEPRPHTSEVLRYTIRGGIFGTAVALGISCFYFLIPLLVGLLALASSGLAPEQRAVTKSSVLAFGLSLVIPAVAGGIFGSLFMSITSALLHVRPGLLHPAAFGAVAGAILPPMVVFLVAVVPTAINGNDPQAATLLVLYWLRSLALALAGSIIGFVCGVIAGVLKHDGRETG